MGKEQASVVDSVDLSLDNETTEKFWPHGWWKIFDIKVGIIPLPLFLMAAILITALCLTGELPSQLTTMVVVLGFFGFICGEFGKRLPFLGKIGAAAICATFIPSALVYYHLLPASIVDSTKVFYKSTGILYLYISCIIVGSIFSMDRKTIMQGFLRIFIPMLCGEIVGAVVGVTVGSLLGLGAFHSLFFIVLPIMAGGVGEGAIPLSIGFHEIMHIEQGVAFAQIIPMVMLGSLTAILVAGILNHIGKRKPHLTGEGRLMPGTGEELGSATITNNGLKGAVDVTGLASAAMMALLLYMAGILGQRLVGLPAPVGMLFVAVLVKLTQAVSPQMTSNANVVYKFFQTSVTYPILFMVGVAITPWQSLVAAFTIPNLIVIISTVLSLVTTGFFVGKKMGMHPIDVAIVSCCQSGQGGTGDVAILTSGNRMSLMPFAQIATRIGGAINVTLALVVLSHFFTF
jgi:Na+/citrate or Na+/malate symporter